MTAPAIAFYERHPISAAQITARLEAQRGTLDDLTPPDLFDHDQDHYGALAANDALAAAARLSDGKAVADFCAGLGGPARYYAHTYGVSVTGIELTPARVEGAATLTRLVGLDDRVRVVEGNVMAVPLPDESVDAVVSQEAFLHVPETARAVAEAYRILKPGGRFAFTDWVLHKPMTAEDAEIMQRGQAVRDLQSPESYRALLQGAGFKVAAAEDLTADWGPILEKRFAMYRKLKEETQKAGTPSGDDAFYESYAHLVALVTDGTLGGARFTAEKP